MFGLRKKLALGLGGLLLILAIFGIQSIRQIRDVGQSINAILSENYKSIAACQEIKDAVREIDSGVLLVHAGYEKEGINRIESNIGRLYTALNIELNNITIPGEQEKVNRLRDFLRAYRPALQNAIDTSLSPKQRAEIYHKNFLPASNDIIGKADDILRMNQDTMFKAEIAANERAHTAQRKMYAILLAGAIIAAGFIMLIRQWVLLPVRTLIEYTNEIRRGNLDVVIHRKSNDEIGQLSTAFNAMTASLRELTRSDRAKLSRIKQITQQAFKTLPDAVAMINSEGVVEESTELAQEVFGLKPGIQIESLPFIWMSDLMEGMSKSGRTEEFSSKQIIQHFVRGEEHFFRPRMVPILNQKDELTGSMLIVEDITHLQQQEEMKRSLISMVSHQLKTPLTSIRMGIHLLLEEKIGPLNSKQMELMIAARDDSDRLNTIIDDLLDISKIQSGKVAMEMRVVSPQDLIEKALEEFKTAIADRGLTINTEIQADLPQVWADPNRIEHVFANLLSNAVKYTAPGGKITLTAAADEENVKFSVKDTGKGIPSCYIPHVFEQFFRIPDSEAGVGAGLGLAIAKEIVDAHGGTIEVESKEGAGSEFIFTIRRADKVSL